MKKRLILILAFLLLAGGRCLASPPGLKSAGIREQPTTPVKTHANPLPDKMAEGVKSQLVKSGQTDSVKDVRVPGAEPTRNTPVVEPGSTLYHIPFGSSSGNTIQLVVANSTDQIASQVRVKPSSPPGWLHLSPAEQSIPVLKGKSETTVNFTFTVDRAAPVKCEQKLNLSIKTSTGEEWVKQIRIMVDAPTRYELYQNYPNPFNPSTTIEYDLPSDGLIRISIYNILGQEVKTLVNEVKEAGHQTAVLNGTDLPSGVYFYRLQAGSFSEVRKMMLVR